MFAWDVFAWANERTDNHWLNIDVSGDDGNRQAIGAQVTVYTPNRMQTQEVGINDSSFFSQGHYRLYFGLGDSEQADRVTVRWTDGKTAELTNVAADQLLHVTPPRTHGLKTQ